MKVRGTRVAFACAWLICFALLGAVFLMLVGVDALEWRHPFQFFADSATYHEAARGGLAHVSSLREMVGVAGNFLGPVMLLRAVGENYYLVMVVNIAIMMLAIASLARTLDLDALKLLVLLLINPITVSSLLSVNKEIISVVVLACFLHGVKTRSTLTLLAALCAAVLVRWQLTMVLLVVLAMNARVNPLRHARGTSLVLLLVGLSVAYLAAGSALQGVRESFAAAAAQYEGSGLYTWLVGLQDRGWYWAIFPLKAAHLLFGLGLRFDRLFAPTDIYNDIWQLLHSTAMLVLFVVLVARRRFHLRNDYVYISLIYIAIIALTPIYTPRYFFPVYVLWALAACSPSGRLFAGPVTSHSFQQLQHRPVRQAQADHT